MFKISLLYLALISLIGIAVTVYDKTAAKAGRRRIPEQTLLCISALGGSFAMLITMIIISHKTRHIQFMAGIPLIIVIQYIFTFFIFRYLTI